MARDQGIWGARARRRQVALLLPLAVGVGLLVYGLQRSEVVPVLLGSILIVIPVTSIIGIAGAVRHEHRRQVESGWLQTLPLTYDGVGTSVERTIGEHRATIGAGRATFESAAAAVLRWQVKTRAGFRVIRVGEGGAFFSDEPVVENEAAIVRLGPIRETVKVTRVVDEARRRGFAYGTLPEHPLRGEEAFLVEWRENDDVDLVIRSFSRPNGWFWWVLTPALAVVRQVFLRRYLRALLD